MSYCIGRYGFADYVEVGKYKSLIPRNGIVFVQFQNEWFRIVNAKVQCNLPLYSQAW